MSSMGYNDARLANSTTGIYLQRSFNIEPPSARFMPGVGRAKNYSERLRMGKDCDEVYPGIIIGKKAPFLKVFAVSDFATLTSTCHSGENVHFHLF